MQKTTRRHSLAGKAILCCVLAAASILPGCGSPRYCCADNNTAVRIHGTRAVLNPASAWGGKTPLQESWILEAMNGFFAEYAARLDLPQDMRVHNHPDGASLLYTWTDAAGRPEMLTQTARPSAWFTLLSLNGRLGHAQERDWGFVSTPRFARDNRESRAGTILHEFWHQYAQIKHCGVGRYWLAYIRQILTHGYRAMPIEKQAYVINDLFDEFIRARYGIVMVEKKRPRCRAITKSAAPEQSPAPQKQEDAAQ